MDFPYPLFRVPGAQVLGTLEQLHCSGNGVPIILGDEESFNRVQDGMEVEEGYVLADLVVQMLAEIDEIDPQLWFAERAEEDPEYYAIEAGEWPDDIEVPSDNLIAHCDILTGEPYPEVFIAAIPAEHSWMTPCYLNFGNWNAVPSAPEHAAIFRYWLEKYGASVVSLADDVVELIVARPPRTREEALALAKEQYIYCPDIVQQGVGSVEALAATLINSTVWFFWWD